MAGATAVLQFYMEKARGVGASDGSREVQWKRERRKEQERRSKSMGETGRFPLIYGHILFIYVSLYTYYGLRST